MMNRSSFTRDSCFGLAALLAASCSSGGEPTTGAEPMPGAAATQPAAGGTTAAGDTGAGGAETNAGGAVASAGGASISGGTGGTNDNPEPGACVPGDPADPYARRCGSFKAMLYTRTETYRHDDSIATGHEVLPQLAADNGFEMTVTEENDLFTEEGLSQFELIVFLSPTGDVLDDPEQAVFENWMQNGGAFVGIHGASVVEADWQWYRELLGQNFLGAGIKDGDIAEVRFEAAVAEHPAVKGLPNPWIREEEFYSFPNMELNGEGFQVVARVYGSAFDGAPDGQPTIWLRQHQNYRMFYTQLGHHPKTFRDPEFQKHLLGAMMWTVRRQSDLD